MPMQIEQIMRRLNDIFLQEIQSDPNFRALQASGKSLAFLKSNASVKIAGAKFTKYGLYPKAQDKGIKHFIPIAPLMEWVALKKYGINFKNEKEQKSIAWAIAKNAKKRGTFKYRNPTEIYSTAAKAAIQKLKNEITYADISGVITI
jgi:hypothetical protein